MRQSIDRDCEIQDAQGRRRRRPVSRWTRLGGFPAWSAFASAAAPRVAALVFLVGIVTVHYEGLSREANGSETWEDTACVLCAEDPGVPVVRITEAWLDSIADCRSRFNMAQITRIDSLYSGGHFGPVGDKQSIQRAHLLARLTMINAYPDLVRMACDETRVYEADQKAIEKVVARYSDLVLFGVMRLERLRMGRGHVCVRYNVDEKAEGECRHGGKVLRWRVKDVKIDGQNRRVLSIDVPTGAHDVVEAILARHHHFKVEYDKSDGPPAPYEWFLVYDIEGAWVRKWGLHKPSAYMYWVSSPSGGDAAPSPSVASPSEANGMSAELELDTGAAVSNPRAAISRPDSAAGNPGAVGDQAGAAAGQPGPSTSQHDSAVGKPAAVADHPSPTISHPGAILAYVERAVCAGSGYGPGSAREHGPGTELPPVPFVGIRMYVRGLHFRLPSFLPDINLDDLRVLELAMPILDMNYLWEARQPSWLGSDADWTFADWEGYGDVPPGVRARFPDR